MRRTSAGAVGNEAWPRALDLDQRGLLAEARRRTRFEAERIRERYRWYRERFAASLAPDGKTGTCTARRLGVEDTHADRDDRGARRPCGRRWLRPSVTPPGSRAGFQLKVPRHGLRRAGRDEGRGRDHTWKARRAWPAHRVDARVLPIVHARVPRHGHLSIHRRRAGREPVVRDRGHEGGAVVGNRDALTKVGAGSSSPTKGAQIDVEICADRTLRIRLGGRWTLAEALPSTRLVGGQATFRARDLALVVQECGPQALPIVTLINFLVGLIIAFVGAVELQKFGATIYVADLVAIATVRELGCIMTGIIMAGRTGSGFAAQLGTMNVNQEIEAFVTMGVPPMDFLVLPRMLALCLMMPLLGLYADLIGILGGATVAVGMLAQSPTQYWEETRHAIGFMSIGLGIGKSLVFGVLIALAGCLRGMKCGRDAAAVGQAATSAVVLAIVWIIGTDGILAVICNVVGI